MTQARTASRTHSVISTQTDLVNSPAHYTQGRFEAIDVIEDVIKGAPDPISGMLLGNTLKYLLRVWFKDLPIQDLRKAQWYLNRLIQHLEAKESKEFNHCLTNSLPPFDDPLQ